MSDWQAQQQVDESHLQEDIHKALDAALTRPLTMDEAMLLAWSSGVANDFYKEHRK